MLVNFSQISAEFSCMRINLDELNVSQIFALTIFFCKKIIWRVSTNKIRRWPAIIARGGRRHIQLAADYGHSTALHSWNEMKRETNARCLQGIGITIQCVQEQSTVLRCRPILTPIFKYKSKFLVSTITYQTQVKFSFFHFFLIFGK